MNLQVRKNIMPLFIVCLFVRVPSELACAMGSLTLLRPNGGEEIKAGQWFDIAWVTEGVVDEILIEYFTPDSPEWLAIAVVENTGFYRWRVPQQQNTHCLLRISDCTNPAIMDFSDDFFTIGRVVGPGGPLLAWGDNAYGQCDVPVGDDFVAVAAGGYHGVALRADGSLAAWGDDRHGECDVPEGNTFVEVAATTFGGSSFALKVDGSIVGWGGNADNLLDVPEGNDFVTISAGYYNGAAIRSNGSIVVWGNGQYGQLEVPGGNDFVSIACDGGYCVALKADGSLIRWGNGGNNVPAGNDFVSVTSAYGHMVALRADGSTVTWPVQQDSPQGTHYVAVAGGYHHGLALHSDGTVASWGLNDCGQTEIPDGYAFSAIVGGIRYSAGILSSSLSRTLTVNVEPPHITSLQPSIGSHGCAYLRPVLLQAGRFINCPEVYRFGYWKGDVEIATSPATSVIMDSDKSVTAVFLDDRQCGDECHAFPNGDLNQDCEVNLLDIAIMARTWLECTKPECD